MRKLFTASVLALTVMLVASSSQAAETTYDATYTTGGVAGAGLQYPANDPDFGDIGGVRYSGYEGAPASLSIADDYGTPAGVSGTGINFFAGQDLNGNTIVGEDEASEPSISGCARPGQEVSLAAASFGGFVPGADITVFVMTVTGSSGCRGAATQGTVTLTTEVAE